MTHQVQIRIREDLQEYVEHIACPGERFQLRCKMPNCNQYFTFNERVGWTNIVKHMINRHCISESAFPKRRKAAESGPTDTSIQKKMSRGRTRVYPKNSAKQRQFIRDLLDLIAVAGLPLRICDHKVFILLVRHLDPHIKVPCRRALGRKFKECFINIKQQYVTLLKEVDTGALHISLDLWPSILNNALFGMRVHFIDKNWELKRFTIAFHHLEDLPNSESVRSVVKDFLYLHFCVTPEKVGIVMADNAAEMMKAFCLDEISKESDTSLSEDTEDSSDFDSEDDADVIENSDFSELCSYPDPFANSSKCGLDGGEDILGEALENIVMGVSDWSIGCKLKRLGCNAHALHLVVKESICGNDRALEITQLTNELVSFFNLSNYWTRQLTEKTKLRLIRLCGTSWNSVLFAMEHIIKSDFAAKLNEVLLAAKNMVIGPEKARVPSPLDPQLLKDMKEMCQILSPVADLSKKLQTSSVTSSTVIPGILSVYKILSALELTSDGEMAAFRSTLCLAFVEQFAAPFQSLYCGRGPERRLLQILDNKEYVLATLLDPRMKTKPFIVPLQEPYGLDLYAISKEKALSILEMELKSKGSEKRRDEPHEDPTGVVEDTNHSKSDSYSVYSIAESLPGPSEKKDCIFDILMTEDNVPSSSDLSSIAEEMKAYFDEPCSKKMSDPLQYWKLKESIFPHLSRLAKVYLAFPASSSSVERLFSVAGSIARARQAKLSISNLEILLMYRDYKI